MGTPSSAPKSKKLIIWVAGAVVLTALVVGGGMYYFQNQQADQAMSDLQGQIDTLRFKLSAAATPTPSPSASATPSPTATPVPTATPKPTATPVESTLIKNTAIADAEAEVGVTGVTATISATSGANFAKVSMGTNPGGYSAILKKVNGIWVVVTKGQALPNKADGAKYGLPAGWYSTDY